MRQVIDKYAALPFSYGLDCCQFAAECVESITDENPMDALKYGTEREALALIQHYGGMEGALRHFLGEPYEGRKDGDVCMISANNGRHAAAVIYRGRVVARVETGLMDYPIERALMVWAT